MSADNWDECPQCGVECALREDYEFWWECNEIHVSYRCVCYECGFKYNFKHVEKPQMTPTPEAPHE